MKKIFLTTLILLFFISAQAQWKVQPRAGVKAGINISNLTISEVGDQNNRYGYHLGLFSLIPLKNRFGLQLETLYTTKGSGLTTNADFPFGTSPQTEVEVYLNYLDIPVGLVYQLNPFVTLRGGAYGNILLSSQVEAIGEDIVPAVERDQFNRFGVGLFVGAGFNVHPITLGVRYNHGLTAIGQEELPGQYLDEARHSLIQLYLEYSFKRPRDAF